MRRLGGMQAVALVAITGLVLAGLFAAPAAAADGDVIITYAGGLGAGEPTNVGQTPAAIAAFQDEESGVAYVYVADTEFNVVRRIDVTAVPPTESVFAGTGEMGPYRPEDDGVPATEAVLGFRDWTADTPGEPGLAVDAEGNLYIADYYNHVVRRVDAAGIITTIAGNGIGTFAGDGGLATDASLQLPSGLAFDTEGDLYIADSANHRVRKVMEVLGDIKITTFAGNGTGSFGGDGGLATNASLSSPSGIAIDPEDTVFIADRDNCRIRAVDASLNITTFAGGSGCSFVGADGSVATEARLRWPRSVAVDAATGDVYVADTENCLVRRVDFDGRIYTAVGVAPSTSSISSRNCGDNDGDGIPTSQKLDLPLGVALLSGDLLVADTGNYRVRKLSGADLSTYAGNGRLDYSGDGGPAVDAQLLDPWGVATGPDGSVYFSDWSQHVIRKIDPDGVITTVAGTGEEGYNVDEELVTATKATDAQLDHPTGVAVDAEDNLYIADTDNCIIRKVDGDGNISRVAGVAPDPEDPTNTSNCAAPNLTGVDPALTTPLNHPHDVDIGPNGHLFIADTDNHSVMKSDGAHVERVGGTGVGGSAANQLFIPQAIAVDSDDDGNAVVFVADTGNNRVQQIEGGSPSTVVDQLLLPRGIETADGNVYVADTHHDVIKKVDAAGVVSVFAGTGERGFAGDRGLPASAEFDRPHGVAATTEGVYIVDRFNMRVRRVGLTVPSVPLDVVGVPGDAEASVSWSAPDEGGAPIETYRVATFAASELEQPVGEPIELSAEEPGDELVVTVPELGNGTAYVFSVTATNRFGDSDPAFTGETTPRTTPDAPTGVSAKAGDRKATVSWTPPDDDGGAPITSFEVTSSPDGKTATAEADNASATVTGLTNGKSYTFTVTALNEAGASDPSAPSDPVTPKASSKPAGSSPSSPGSGGGASAIRSGYWMLGAPGTVFAFGDAEHKGNATVAGAAVDIEATPAGNGYWVLDDGGSVHTFGDATHHGALNGVQPGEKVTSMSATPSGGGYWLFTTLGRVATFGDAAHFGDMSGTSLNGPVLDSVATPSGKGYYMVASDGGVFAFGDAAFYGSMGGKTLNEPVQSLTADPDGVGYWLVASDGGIFAFDAPFHGSMGHMQLNQPVTRMVSFGSAGYLMVATDGGIFSFGSAPFYGSLGANPPPYPIRSVAVLNVR